SGAVVRNTAVMAKNEKTGEARTVMTNDQGRYVIPNLKPSTYTLRVEVKGFAPLEVTGLPLAVGQEFPMDLAVSAAGVNEVVKVTAAAAVLDVSSAKIG